MPPTCEHCQPNCHTRFFLGVALCRGQSTDRRRINYVHCKPLRGSEIVYCSVLTQSVHTAPQTCIESCLLMQLSSTVVLLHAATANHIVTMSVRTSLGIRHSVRASMHCAHPCVRLVLRPEACHTFDVVPHVYPDLENQVSSMFRGRCHIPPLKTDTPRRTFPPQDEEEQVYLAHSQCSTIRRIRCGTLAP